MRLRNCIAALLTVCIASMFAYFPAASASERPLRLSGGLFLTGVEIMSYSVNVNAPTKAGVISLLKLRFDEVKAQQPVHAADIEQATAAAESFIAVLQEPEEGQELYIGVSGHLSWRGTDQRSFTGAGFSFSASTRSQV